MKHVLHLTLLLFCLPSLMHGQSTSGTASLQWLNWITATPDGYGYTYGYQVDTDLRGDIYTLGHSTIGAAISIDSIQTARGYQLVKLNSAQQLVDGWGICCDIYNKRPHFALDRDRNIVIVATLDSIDQPAVYGSAPLHATGLRDMLVTKLDSSGSLVWVRQTGGVGTTQGNKVAIDPQGNIYVLGSYSDTLDADPGPGTAWLYASHPNSIFLQKLDPAGNLLWVKSWSSAAGPVFSSVLQVDTLGQPHLVGHFRYTHDFDPGAGTHLLDGGSEADVFFMKLTTQGDLIWVKHIGNDGRYLPTDAVIDVAGNLVTVGNLHKANIDVDPGPDTALVRFPPAPVLTANTLLVHKLDATGTFQWFAHYSGTDYEEAVSIWGQGISTDACGNVYVTGPTNDGLRYTNPFRIPGEPQAEEETEPTDHPETGATISYLVKISPRGRTLWLRYQGNSLGDYDDTHRDIALDPDGAIYTTGQEGDWWSIKRFIQPLDTFDTSMNLTVCDRYVSPSEMYVWDTTGIYHDTVPLYCGSPTAVPVEIHLTVKNSSYGIDSVMGCRTAVVNGASYWQSGTYTQRLVNTVGCDSILTLHVTVRPIIWSDMSATGCGYYNYNGNTYTQEGSYTNHLTSQYGCDSVVILHVTLQDSLDIHVGREGRTLQAAAWGRDISYQWIDCQTGDILPGQIGQELYATADGAYAVIISNGLCTDTSACLTVGVSGLDDALPRGWQLYPNPSRGTVALTLDRPCREIMVEVATVQGQLLHRIRAQDTDALSIALPETPGLYLLRVSADGHRSVARVLRE